MNPRVPATDLGALLAALPEPPLAGSTPGVEQLRITGLADDSRAAGPGTLFFALRGRDDGHAYVRAALARGAAACVVDVAGAQALRAGGDAGPLVVVPETRLAVSRLAAQWFGRPSEALRTAGITGTNGKTTTTFLLEAILAAAGLPVARIGTLGVHAHGTTVPLANTTPLALELQRTLAELRDAGTRAVAMEVSSHALALDRVADVRFAVAVLTNVTRDHLDFHGDFAAYAAAKRRLFAPDVPAVFNADDALGRAWSQERAAASAGAPVVTYALEAGHDGAAAGATLVAREITLAPAGSSFTVDGLRFSLALPGRFNIANALAALGAARLLGVPDAFVRDALAGEIAVPGRMQRVDGGALAGLVDYAHTPDALATVLATARDLTPGRLIVVFGCGGDRDRGKRPLMGRIAADAADVVVVTSDNPRTESAQAILAAVVAGIPASAQRAGRLIVEPDRAAAIRQAVAVAATGDLIVVAGKGHEAVQIVGDERRRFDDAEELAAAFAERGLVAAGAR